MNDLDMSGITWNAATTAIGDQGDLNMNGGYPFTGLFNGSNYAIRNLTITGSGAGSTAPMAAMFPRVTPNAVVKDLNVEGLNVSQPNGRAAGLTWMNWGLITNVHITGMVSGLNAAGLVAITNNTTSLSSFSGIVDGAGGTAGFMATAGWLGGNGRVTQNVASAVMYGTGPVINVKTTDTNMFIGSTLAPPPATNGGHGIHTFGFNGLLANVYPYFQTQVDYNRTTASQNLVIQKPLSYAPSDHQTPVMRISQHPGDSADPGTSLKTCTSTTATGASFLNYKMRDFSQNFLGSSDGLIDREGPNKNGANGPTGAYDCTGGVTPYPYNGYTSTSASEVTISNNASTALSRASYTTSPMAWDFSTQWDIVDGKSWPQRGS